MDLKNLKNLGGKTIKKLTQLVEKKNESLKKALLAGQEIEEALREELNTHKEKKGK